jgi:Secretion system C-terminal sorting domain
MHCCLTLVLNSIAKTRTGVVMKKLYLLLVFFLFSFPLLAQNFWVATNGPSAGTVLCLAIGDNGYIYAGTDGSGVYRSTDSGNTWVAANSGMTLTHVSALVIDKSGNIYAGTKDSGIFRSTDNGFNWSQIDSGLTNTQILALIITNSGALLAGTNGGGIFKSTNNGNVWSNNGNTDTTYAFAKNPRANAFIYAGTGSSIYRSTDDGNSWTKLLTFANITYGNVTTMVITNNGYIYAGDNYYFGVYRSTDNGNSWTQITTSPFTLSHVSSLANNVSGFLFAASFGDGNGFGVVESTDYGNVWNYKNTGLYIMPSLPFTYISSLAMDKNGFLFAADQTDGKVYKSVNTTTVAPPKPVLYSPGNNSKGNSLAPTLSWVPELSADKFRLEVNTKSDFTGSIIYDQDTLTNYSKQISGLTDNTTYYWRVTASTNYGQLSDTSATFSFTTKLLSTSLSLPANNSMGVSLSPTLSWTTVIGADKYRLEVNTKSDFSGTIVYDKDTVSLVTKQIGGLTDNTKYYWRVTALNNLGNTSDTSSTFSFTTGQTLLSEVTNGALGITTSPTLSWNKTTGANTYRLEVNKNSDFTGTYVYDNATLTDTLQALSGLSYNTTYYWRVTASSNTLAKINTSSVYSFTTELENPALTWPGTDAITDTTIIRFNWNIVIGANFYKIEVNSLRDFSGDVKADSTLTDTKLALYKGLGADSTYYWRVTAFNNAGNQSVASVDSFKTSIATGIEDLTNTIPSVYKIYQNYPNPFNPTTTIKYSVPNSSFVTIKVYDILGRMVKSLVNEQKVAGNYSVQFNGSNFASGIYFYRMQAGDFVQTKKLILMK